MIAKSAIGGNNTDPFSQRYSTGIVFQERSKDVTK